MNMIHTPERLEHIRERATAFRAAIEACDKNILCMSFEEFPNGSCGDASCLLGKYLTDCGLGIFRYAAGEYTKGERYQSHAWLEQRDLIIDITADQFSSVHTPVWLTTERDWHKKFEIKTEEESEEYFQGSSLARDYAEIRKLLP